MIHGQLLPMIGGPLHGQTRPVEFVFHDIPGFDGGVPSSMIRFDAVKIGTFPFTADEHCHVDYYLDKDREAWVYMMEDTQ